MFERCWKLLCSGASLAAPEHFPTKVVPRRYLYLPIGTRFVGNPLLPPRPRIMGPPSLSEPRVLVWRHSRNGNHTRDFFCSCATTAGLATQLFYPVCWNFLGFVLCSLVPLCTVFGVILSGKWLARSIQAKSPHAKNVFFVQESGPKSKPSF